MLEEETALTAETARAMRELARTVTDAPPLRLARPQGNRARVSAPRRRWQLWAIPLTTAVAVVGLAIALVVVRDLPGGSAARSRATSSASSSPSPAAAGVPGYYAAVEANCAGCFRHHLVVGDTFTGAKVATLASPRGSTIEAVSAASNDRTFVVDAVSFPLKSQYQYVTWYLLTVTPGASSPVRLTRLPIPSTPTDALVGSIVLSASGREVAVTYEADGVASGQVLQVYSVTSGKLLRTWQTDAGVLEGNGYFPYMQSNNGVSWVNGDRALSFATTTYTSQGPKVTSVDYAVRSLDVTSRSGNLLAVSHVVWSKKVSIPEPAATEPACLESMSLIANGKTIVCDGISGGPSWGCGTAHTRYTYQLLWGAYETSTPKAAARTLYKRTASITGSPSCGGYDNIEWANASGSAMIIEWSIAAPPHLGAVIDGRFTPLPSALGATIQGDEDIAW